MFSKSQRRKFERYGKVPRFSLFDEEVKEARKKIYRKPQRLPASELKSLIEIERKTVTL